MATIIKNKKRNSHITHISRLANNLKAYLGQLDYWHTRMDKLVCEMTERIHKGEIRVYLDKSETIKADTKIIRRFEQNKFKYYGVVIFDSVKGTEDEWSISIEELILRADHIDYENNKIYWNYTDRNNIDSNEKTILYYNKYRKVIN